MKIPKGLTEKQVIDQINIVVNRIAPRYTFYGYTADDIKQESFIICMEALNRYDQKRPLENFLSVNLSNRLKNFVRDNYFIAESNDERIKVLQPVQLDYEDTLIDKKEKYSVDEEKIDKDSCNSYIDKFLPASMRMDYLKIINNVYITKSRRDEVVEKVKEILEEVGYEKG